jgi:two-component system, sensor histidine kinase PdtaS
VDSGHCFWLLAFTFHLLPFTFQNSTSISKETNKVGYFIRHLATVVLLLTILTSAQAQQGGSSEVKIIIKQLQSGAADTSRVKMLLRLSTIYLNKTLNPTSDMDSALGFASQALNLAHQIKFTNGEEEAIFLKGRILINQQNTVAAQRMLENVSSENRIKLLLELGKSMLRTTYSQKSNRDSAMFFFREAARLSDIAGSEKLKEESQCLLGVVYLLKNNWQEGKAHFLQVVDARQRANDKAGQVNALLRLATTVFCDDCTENIIALKRALDLSQQIGDQSMEALIRLQLGYKYLNDGNTKRAEDEAIAALKIQQTIGYPAIYHAYKTFAAQSVYYPASEYGYLSNAYYLLSDLSQTKGDLNQKLFYIFKVVDDVEKTGTLEELDYTYFRLGNAYWELGQFDKSMEYHNQSAAISYQKGELIQVGLARRITVALLKQGKAREALVLLHEIIRKNLLCNVQDKIYIAQSLGSCYNALEEYTLAEKFYLESVAWGKQSPLRYEFIAYQGIAQFYVANAQYARAEPYLKLLLKASSPQQILPNNLIDVHLMWFKVDSAQHNYTAAIRHYQQYKALQDSIYNETKSKQINQLSIQYETAKKEQDIKIKGKEVALLKEQNESQRKQSSALIVGAALLLAILALGLNRYRLKQRVNRQLQQQQQALHIQQQEIRQKNENLSELVAEKDLLLVQKDTLLVEKDQLLTEKEWLLKEIHHRVKNNFHIVASLLEIQSSYLKNKQALSAIKDSQHRIHSMSIIHQKLYQSDTLSTINMAEYIYELVEYLRESYAIREDIGFTLQVENIELNHASAITLGLILNEAITNAIKYAFGRTKDKNISISLSHISESQILLSIADNGRGLPTDFDSKIGASMGMELLQGLTDDLGGSFTIETNNGTHIKVIFDYKPVIAPNVSMS